jgi:predicted 3-demethylubiquinone-9 3-methyltransferase (glyoxalase superfamily)
MMQSLKMSETRGMPEHLISIGNLPRRPICIAALVPYHFHPMRRGGMNMQKITPFLWFDDKAEEAMNFYVSIFRNSRVLSVTRFGEDIPELNIVKGRVSTAVFQLDGREFMALDGGPLFPFTEAISFHIDCDSQEEVDDFWEKLSEGGEKGRCGWLKDKYGVSWQVIPSVLGEMLQDRDAAKSQRVMHAMLQMGKIDIAQLKAAYGRGER